MSTDVDETIKEAFYIFDSDGSGAISSEEFRKVMMTLGAQMTEEEVTEIIEEVDVDGDGQINLEGMLLDVYSKCPRANIRLAGSLSVVFYGDNNLCDNWMSDSVPNKHQRGKIDDVNNIDSTFYEILWNKW